MRCGPNLQNVARLAQLEILDEARVEEEETWLLPVAISVAVFLVVVIAAVVGEI